MEDEKYYQELKKNTEFFAKRFDMNKCIEKYRDLIEGEQSGQ